MPFPSLKELTLRDFPKLKEWCGSNGKQVFPCLEKLTVNKCPNLTSAPVLPSLQHLELQCCHPLFIKSMENLTSLSILVIDTFPFWTLSSVLHFIIYLQTLILHIIFSTLKLNKSSSPCSNSYEKQQGEVTFPSSASTAPVL